MFYAFNDVHRKCFLGKLREIDSFFVKFLTNYRNYIQEVNFFTLIFWPGTSKDFFSRDPQSHLLSATKWESLWNYKLYGLEKSLKTLKSYKNSLCCLTPKQMHTKLWKIAKRWKRLISKFKWLDVYYPVKELDNITV